MKLVSNFASSKNSSRRSYANETIPLCLTRLNPLFTFHLTNQWWTSLMNVPSMASAFWKSLLMICLDKWLRGNLLSVLITVGLVIDDKASRQLLVWNKIKKLKTLVLKIAQTSSFSSLLLFHGKKLLLLLLLFIIHFSSSLILYSAGFLYQKVSLL